MALLRADSTGQEVQEPAIHPRKIEHTRAPI